MQEPSSNAPEPPAYRKPTLLRYGTIEQLTRAGCFGENDNVSFAGADSPGSRPNFYDVCLS
jgi:hypothetical protein